MADRALREVERLGEIADTASPPTWAWIKLRSRRRAGSASAFKAEASWSASSLEIGSVRSGGQLEAIVVNVCTWPY